MVMIPAGITRISKSIFILLTKSKQFALQLSHCTLALIPFFVFFQLFVADFHTHYSKLMGFRVELLIVAKKYGSYSKGP